MLTLTEDICKKWSKHDPNMIQTWSKHDPTMIQTWSKHDHDPCNLDPNMIQTWPNMTQTWSKHDPNMIQTWSKHDPNMIQTWSNHDPNMIQTWPKHDQNMIKTWSKTTWNYLKLTLHYRHYSAWWETQRMRQQEDCTEFYLVIVFSKEFQVVYTVSSFAGNQLYIKNTFLKWLIHKGTLKALSDYECINYKSSSLKKYDYFLKWFLRNITGAFLFKKKWIKLSESNIKLEKRRYLPHDCLDEGLKGNLIMNVKKPLSLGVNSSDMQRRKCPWDFNMIKNMEESVVCTILKLFNSNNRSVAPYEREICMWL